MSTPKMGHKAQKPLPQNGAKASKKPLVDTIDFDRVSRITTHIGPSLRLLEVYYQGHEYPSMSYPLTTPDLRDQATALFNRLCLMEWPSLCAISGSATLVSYLGPQHEVLRNTKADRRAEIAILHDRMIDHITDEQLRNDIFWGTKNVVDNDLLTAFELESYLTELTNLAKEYGVEGLE